MDHAPAYSGMSFELPIVQPGPSRASVGPAALAPRAPRATAPPLAIEKFHFEIVHGCQLRCVGCPNSMLKPKIKHIAVEDFDRCLRHVDVSHVALLRLFNFGEPLLHPRLPEILEVIRRQTWRVGMVEISTNAQYHNFDMLAKVFATGLVGRLAVSCDGDGTAEDYERLRPPGKWPKLLEFLVAARRLRDAHAPRMELITRTIIDQPDAQLRWSQLLLPLGWRPEFRGWLHMPGSSENMLGRELRVPSGVCSFMQRGNNLYVDYDGTVVPCCVHPRASVLGNLLEASYSELLAGEQRQSFCQALATTRPEMPLCNQCEF